MSFYDDASLVFLPSGEAGKDGKAYSMKPTNGNGDFTFSRGSNLTATRVDSNGLIEKGRENLLTYSNDFSNSAWTPFNASVTSGQSGYDGSNDAYLLNITTASNSSLYRSISMSGVYTTSVYAKANSVDYLGLRDYSLSGVGNWFNLSNGTIASTTSNCIDAKIENVGNGWYRCSITQNRNDTGYTQIGASDNPSYTSTTSGSIYIQDAQLEIGLVATEYIESGATTGLAGLLEDSPRFDYSGGASCPSLLLEPSRTNLVRSSEALINGSYGWTLGSATTLTLNDAISPEGVKNAFRLDIPTGNNTTLVRCNVLESTQYTFSFYVKRGTATELKYSIFNFSNLGNIVATTSYFSQTNTSDFVRIVVNFTTPIGCTDVGCYLDRDSGANGSAWFYGIQLEEGSYPTSYIPNHSGGSVTRNADVNTLLNQSGVIGQTAGTILFDAYFDEADKVNFSISDSSANNFISIETTSSNEVTAKVEQGGSTQATITTATSFFAEGDRLKCAIAYDDRDMAFYINGTQVNTAAPNLIPTCDDIRFGNYDGSIKADQRVNRVVLFTTRISNGNLATLTS